MRYLVRLDGATVHTTTTKRSAVAYARALGIDAPGRVRVYWRDLIGQEGPVSWRKPPRLTRAQRDDIAASLGLTKVRGALGGTYYE